MRRLVFLLSLLSFGQSLQDLRTLFYALCCWPIEYGDRFVPLLFGFITCLLVPPRHYAHQQFLYSWDECENIGIEGSKGVNCPVVA